MGAHGVRPSGLDRSLTSRHGERDACRPMKNARAFPGPGLPATSRVAPNASQRWQNRSDAACGDDASFSFSNGACDSRDVQCSDGRGARRSSRLRGTEPFVETNHAHHDASPSQSPYALYVHHQNGLLMVAFVHPLTCGLWFSTSSSLGCLLARLRRAASAKFPRVSGT